MKFLKVLGVLLAGWITCVLGSLGLAFALLLATHKQGARSTGEAMHRVDLIMALLYLATLPAIYLILGRWLTPVGARLAIVAGQTLLLTGTWLLFAFMLLVALNR